MKFKMKKWQEKVKKKTKVSSMKISIKLIPLYMIIKKMKEHK